MLDVSVWTTRGWADPYIIVRLLAFAEFNKNLIGLEEEWGYFALSELETARGPLKLAIERDLYFTPGPWPEVIVRYRKERGEQA